MLFDLEDVLSLNVLNELAKQLQDLLHPFYIEINPRYQRNVTLADVIEHNTHKKSVPALINQHRTFPILCPSLPVVAL